MIEYESEPAGLDIGRVKGQPRKKKSRVIVVEATVKPIRVCAICGTTEDITRDHIIPESFIKILRAYGINTKGMNKKRKNYQELCKPCNMKKGNKIARDDERARMYLEQLMALPNISPETLQKLDRMFNWWMYEPR